MCFSAANRVKMEQSTATLLMDLKLQGMRGSLSQRLKHGAEADLGYEDFLSLLLQDELDYRRNTRIQRLLRAATLRQAASLESLDLPTQRGLDKKQRHAVVKIRQPRNLQYSLPKTRQK